MNSSQSLHLLDNRRPKAASQNTCGRLVFGNVPSKTSIIGLCNNKADSKFETCCHGGLSRRFCGTVGDLAVDFDILIHFMEVDDLFSFKAALDDLLDYFIRRFISGCLLREHKAISSFNDSVGNV